MVILEFREFTVKVLVGSWYGGRHFRARVGYAYYFPTKVLIYSWDLYTCHLILLKGPSVNPVTVTLAFKCQCGSSVLERNSQSISSSPWTHALAMCLLGHKRSQKVTKGSFLCCVCFPSGMNANSFNLWLSHPFEALTYSELYFQRKCLYCAKSCSNIWAFMVLPKSKIIAMEVMIPGW